MFIHIILTVSFAAAHSHVECTDYNPSTQSCNGYARYYSANKAGHEGTDESKDRNDIVSAGLIQCPATPGGEMYSEKYPMANWTPGSNVSIYWPPRGHQKQQSTPVWIYCSDGDTTVDETAIYKGDPSKDLTLSPFDSTHSLGGDMERIATLPYANSDVCTGTDISWAKCSGSVKVPSTWKQGSKHSCMWIWTLNGAQTYVDCFEVKVDGTPSVTSKNNETQVPDAIPPESALKVSPVNQDLPVAGINGTSPGKDVDEDKKDDSDANIPRVQFVRQSLKFVNEILELNNRANLEAVAASFSIEGVTIQVQGSSLRFDGLDQRQVTKAYNMAINNVLCPHEPEYPSFAISDDWRSRQISKIDHASQQLQIKIRQAIDVIQEANSKYKLSISFNGGKDCTLLLWLYAVSVGKDLPALYVRYKESFREIETFIDYCVTIYKLKLQPFTGDMKAALSGFLKTFEVDAILMGTRRTDPHSSNMTTFQLTDGQKGWPVIMRVNPLLDWTYKEIWQALEIFEVPVCVLYDRGYTSLGGLTDTLPNPQLKDPIQQSGYKKASQLCEVFDSQYERCGRE